MSASVTFGGGVMDLAQMRADAETAKVACSQYEVALEAWHKTLDKNSPTPRKLNPAELVASDALTVAMHQMESIAATRLADHVLALLAENARLRESLGEFIAWQRSEPGVLHRPPQQITATAVELLSPTTSGEGK